MKLKIALMVLVMLCASCAMTKVSDPVVKGGASGTPLEGGGGGEEGGGGPPAPTISFGTPRPHGYGTSAWDVPVIVTGISGYDTDQAAANVTLTTSNASITSGWCAEWPNAYTCFGTSPAVSMSWIGGVWIIDVADGEMAVTVVNPTGGSASVTLGASTFYYRASGQSSYTEVPLTVVGSTTINF